MALERKTGKRAKGRLAQRTEKIVERRRRDDVIDTDISGYIEAFVTGLPEAVKLEQISLSSEEDAKRALAVVSDTMQRLNQQIANAKALQVLLNSSLGKG